MNKQPVHISFGRSPATDGQRAAVPPQAPAGEERCRCTVFDALTSPTWRVIRQSAGEYHAYGDCGRLYVGLQSDICKAEGYWHVVARSAPELPPAWHIDFDTSTPRELIKAVTVALAADAGTVAEPRPYLHSQHLDDMGAVWQPLVDAGWTIACDEVCYLATSPDGVITLTYAPARKGLQALLYPEAWLVEAVPDPEVDPLWCAMFHDQTPLHLVAAFTTALADTPPWTARRNLLPEPSPTMSNPA